MAETVEVEHGRRESRNPLFKMKNVVKKVGSVTANTVKTAGKLTANTVKTAGKVTANTVKTAGKATGNTLKAAGNVVVHPLGATSKKRSSSSKRHKDVNSVPRGDKSSYRKASRHSSTGSAMSAPTASTRSTTTSTLEEPTFAEPKKSSERAWLPEANRRSEYALHTCENKRSAYALGRSERPTAANAKKKCEVSRSHAPQRQAQFPEIRASGRSPAKSMYAGPMKRSTLHDDTHHEAVPTGSNKDRPDGRASSLTAYALKQQQTTLSKVNDEDDAPSITDDVKGADYYYGLIPKGDIEPLLKKEGDFILRKTEVAEGQLSLTISVRNSGVIRHFLVNQDPDGTFYVGYHHENSVPALIDYYMRSKATLTSTTNAKLYRPIDRPPWLLNHDSILAIKKLGAGAFGEVFLAEHTMGGVTIQVAIKTMRAECDSNSRLKFMKEARLMRRFLHRHLVRIYGVAVHELPLIIVMEFCPGGGLDSYLKKNKGKVTPKVKLRFATEAADGLAYLHQQGCIHRDVAARNVLLSARLDVKISDFGMSLDTPEFHAAKLQKVPIRWLAPETMKSKLYSTKSDVWSYGILVWEIYADAATPYPGLNNVQTRAFVLQDSRMTMPKITQPVVSAVVASCWRRNPNERPEFADILKSLKTS